MGDAFCVKFSDIEIVRLGLENKHSAFGNFQGDYQSNISLFLGCNKNCSHLLILATLCHMSQTLSEELRVSTHGSTAPKTIRIIQTKTSLSDRDVQTSCKKFPNS